MRLLIPFPQRVAADEQQQRQAEEQEALKHIADLRGFRANEIGQYLSAAQQIVEYEDGRKASAETRATAYLAAIAALIPLMTWALGNITPICSSAVGCWTWSALFDAAVLFFVLAAWWCLKTLSVANYHAFGVEDLVQIKDTGRSVDRALVTQTLQLALANRNTINAKIDYLKAAQGCFFRGLCLIAALMALDPWYRLTPAIVEPRLSDRQTLNRPSSPMTGASAALAAPASASTPSAPSAQAASGALAASAAPAMAAAAPPAAPRASATPTTPGASAASKALSR